jgi:hypothetical protein
VLSCPTDPTRRWPPFHDGFFDRHFDPALGPMDSRILIALTDARTLRLEVQPTSTCGSDPSA